MRAGGIIPTPPALTRMSEPTRLPREAETALAAYSAGEISAEIALMRLLLAFGDDIAVFDCLQRLNADELLRLAGENRTGLSKTAALVHSGLVRERSGSIGAILPGLTWSSGGWAACVGMVVVVQAAMATVIAVSWKR